jgi:hypothetical protein
MNDLQNKFLGGYVGIIINSKEEFDTLCLWLNERNLFLADGVPAGSMKYPGDKAIVIYRNDDSFIYWSPLIGIDRSKFELVDMGTFTQEKVIDVEAVPAEESAVMNLDDLPEFEVKSIESAKVNSNVGVIKDQVIPFILKYKDTVVTVENYKDIKKLVTRLNKGSERINRYKIDVKKEANKEVDIFVNDVTEILKAFTTSSSKLKEQVSKFENDAKEERKKEKMAVIEQLKTVLVEQNRLRKEFADQFEYNDAWSNSSCTEKRFKEEVNSLFHALIEKQKNYDEAIKTIEQMIATHKIPDGLMVTSRYIQQYKSGKELADIVTMIAEDAAQIKASLDKQKAQAVEEARETIKKEVLEEQTVQATTNVPSNGNIAQSQENGQMMHADEKTGEIYARTSEKMICIDIQKCPDNIPEDKIFRYEYTFEGNYKAIKTFSLFLKVLQKINPSFKYKGEMVKE